MDRTQKIDCGTNGKVIFTGATTEFQLKKGLTPQLEDCEEGYQVAEAIKGQSIFVNGGQEMNITHILSSRDVKR